MGSFTSRTLKRYWLQYNQRKPRARQEATGFGRLFRPPPHFVVGILDADLSVRVTFDFDLKFELHADGADTLGQRIFDCLGIFVPIERVGSAMMNGHLAVDVGLGDQPVFTGKKLQPLGWCLLFAVGRADERPRPNQICGQFRRLGFRLWRFFLGTESGNRSDCT